MGLRRSLIASFVLIGAGNGLVALAGTGRGIAGGYLVAQQFVKDPAYPIMNVAEMSLRHLITPNRWQGRMHARLRVIEFGGMFVGALFGGWLDEAIGLQATIVTASLGCAAAALPLLLSRANADIAWS